LWRSFPGFSPCRYRLLQPTLVLVSFWGVVHYSTHTLRFTMQHHLIFVILYTHTRQTYIATVISRWTTTTTTTLRNPSACAIAPGPWRASVKIIMITIMIIIIIIIIIRAASAGVDIRPENVHGARALQLYTSLLYHPLPPSTDEF